MVQLPLVASVRTYHITITKQILFQFFDLAFQCIYFGPGTSVFLPSFSGFPKHLWSNVFVLHTTPIALRYSQVEAWSVDRCLSCQKLYSTHMRKMKGDLAPPSFFTQEILHLLFFYRGDLAPPFFYRGDLAPPIFFKEEILYS